MLDRFLTFYAALPLVCFVWLVFSPVLLEFYGAPWVVDVPATALVAWIVSFFLLRVVSAPLR